MYNRTKVPGVGQHTCTTSVDSFKFFEGEELLKARHVLVENYKAIFDPNSQDVT